MQSSHRGRPVRIGSGTVVGVDAIPVTIEAIMHGDAKNVRLLGSVDRVVREAFHRVLNAFVAEGLQSPRGMPIVNFAPAALPKTGTGFDLPLALALAGAGGQIPAERLSGIAAVGEIALDGRVLPSRGVVPIAVAAREHGWHTLLACPTDAKRAALVPGIDVLPVRRLGEAIAFGQGTLELTPVDATRLAPDAAASLDLAEIRGHETAKRGLCAVAAGRHNLLLVGPPGSGKSALARRLGGLLPPPAPAERLDILRILSAGGADPVAASSARPIRCPHHTSSPASLLGGGPQPRPGEVTLAHHGVLFLDELPEFRRETLEGLRQPIEEHLITIGRSNRTVTMPADFVLVAAMNPCPCGFDGDPHHPCRCTPREREGYRGRVSGPLLDRFDLVVAVPSLDPSEWDAPVDPEWSTAALRARVAAAEARRIERGARPNGRLDGRALEEIIGVGTPAHTALTRVTRLHRLSGRGRTRIARLARTFADLGDSNTVRERDVYEAARLRTDWVA